jgi:pimeloyl-ACP methyl ester carboxylesterase
MPAFKRDGVNLHYDDIGEGHPVLFLHEFGGDTRSWRDQVRYFSRRYRCLVPAARGYPPSDVPDDAAKYGWEINLADAVGLLDHLGLKTAHVVGLSMGAYIGLLMAMRHGERVSALVAASGGSGAYPPNRDAFIAETLAAADRIEKSGRVPAADMGVAANRLQLKIKDPLGWQAFVDHLAEHPATGAAMTFRHVQAVRPSLYDFETELAAVTAPVLLMVGDEDEPCLDVNLYMKRLMPTSGLSIAPKSGHLINIEDPAKFNAEIDAFFVAAEAGRWPVRAAAGDANRMFRTDDGDGNGDGTRR